MGENDRIVWIFLNSVYTVYLFFVSYKYGALDLLYHELYVAYS
jgi:hypothetical protein